MITFTAQRKCFGLDVTVAATPQSLEADLSVSQGTCDILCVTRLALSFCVTGSPSSHSSVLHLHPTH